MILHFLPRIGTSLLLLAVSFQLKPVLAANPFVFTNSSLINPSTVINFEPSGSGNTLSAVNAYLSPRGATLAISGGDGQINNLVTNGYGGGGLDGGPVSGQWGIQGGAFAETVVKLTFTKGKYVEAVGTYWGGVVNSNARTIVTFEDNTTFTVFLNKFLPLVPNSATEAHAINGFLGVNGNGTLIKSVSFVNNNDWYSQDDIAFGIGKSSKAVPEPSGLLGMVMISGIGFLFIKGQKNLH